MTSKLRDEAAALAPDLVRVRRELHRLPEVGLELPRSQELVLAELAGLGLEISTGSSCSSVTAVLRGGRPSGATVLLRADMDGLPVPEETGLPYASTVPGAMHACGHDLHTAMLVGAARLLAARRDELAGDVVLMFQPGEEGFDGAGRMLDEGVLTASGSRVTSAYALHVLATIESGLVQTRPGTLMAASAALDVRVRGAGGHGSMPHKALDPVSVAAQLVGDIQTMVTRRFDVFDPVVVTVGSLHAGRVRNVIPDVAEIEATVRCFSHEAQARVEVELVRLCRGVAAAHGLEADVTFRREYPATVNDASHASFVGDVVGELLGAERFTVLPQPLAGSEDFSRVLMEVPGCYLVLGAQVDSTGQPGQPVADNHSPRVVFDEAVLPDGAAILAELAIRAAERDAAV